MSNETQPVVNFADVPLQERLMGARWGARYHSLTPSMRPKGGSLGVNRMVLPPGRAAVPFHSHQREDEVFYILSGAGTLRYGEELYPLKAGDCVSCPAGTGVAHQIGNTGTEDLVYLAVGNFDPDEVCVYPDNGKVMVRSIQQVGFLEKAAYMDGEPDTPKIFDLVQDG